MLPGVPGSPQRGEPTPDEPTGRSVPRAWSAPLSAQVGLQLPEREMDATDRWELNETELEDVVDDDPAPTLRHRRAF